MVRKKADVKKRGNLSKDSLTKTLVNQIKKETGKLGKQLRAERRAGIPDSAQLQANVEQAQLQVDAINSEKERLKDAASNRKNEITEWKQWYDALPGLDKTVELEQLNHEVQWRLKEVVQLETDIGKLYGDEFEVSSQLELAKQQLTAFEAGVFERPVDQDPRLIAARKTIEKEEAELNKTRTKPNSKRSTKTRKAD